MPARERVIGIDLQSDAVFRARILQVCELRDRVCVEVASGLELDAIGNLYGIIREGLR